MYFCAQPPTLPEQPDEQRDHGKGEKNVQNPRGATGDRQKEKHKINHVALGDLKNESGQRATEKTPCQVEVFLPPLTKFDDAQDKEKPFPGAPPDTWLSDAVN